MIIEVKPRIQEKGFFTVSPVDSWEDTSVDNDGWLICCEIDTSSLIPETEQIFLAQLRQIVFYRIKNHVVTVNDFVTGIQQDAFYELVEHFGLDIIR